MLTPEGEKLIERFKPRDWVLSAPEGGPEAAPEPRHVEEVFVNLMPLLEVRVSGRTIQTTSEHPFYVRGRGWTAAKELRAGDQLRSHDGQSVAVESVTEGEGLAPVYNLRVQDYHTYFVGGEDWGFSVWAHNTCAGLHHYVPMFMGSMVQRGSTFGRSLLTWFEQIGHIGIHRALNRYLQPLGMMASRTNPGRLIMSTFSKTDRLKALVQFYKEYEGGIHLQGFLAELQRTIKAELFR